MLAHVMLLWCRRAGCDILGKHSGLLQAPSAQHALWQKHRLAAVTASTSLTKALHTSHSPETVFSFGLTETQTSPEVSSGRVWHRTETSPDSCSKLLGLTVRELGREDHI